MTEQGDSADGGIKGKTNRGLGWVGLASTMVSVLDFVAIIIILAFWISKEQYGIATSAVWLFPILDIATDLGLSAAVIQRDDHTESRISTVFWMNVIMSGIMFGALYVASGPIATFSGHAVVGSMLIVYGTKLVWQNIYFIPLAMMKRELRYREISKVRIVANMAEFCGKIGFAAAGFGVWCFVLAPLCRVLITGIGTQLYHPWRPKFILRIHEAWDYLRFGLKQSTSTILFYFYTNVDYPIVRFFFGDEALGLYRWAFEVVLEPVRIISKVIIEVAFPTFARLRDSSHALIEQFVAFTRMNLVTTMSFVAFVFIVAEELLFVMHGTKFLPSAPAIRVLCAVGVLRALSYMVPPLLDGLGYPGRTLIYQATAAVCLPILFVASGHFLGDEYGFVSVAIGWAVGYPIAFFVLAVMGLRALKMTIREYLRRIIGVPLCVAAAMAVGALVRLGVDDFAPWARLLLVGVPFLGVFGLLLAYTQGISPRTVAKAIKS